MSYKCIKSRDRNNSFYLVYKIMVNIVIEKFSVFVKTIVGYVITNIVSISWR